MGPAARVELSDKLPLSQPIAFLNEHLGDPLVVVEGQVDLAQIDVSEQHQFVGPAFTMRAHQNRPADAPTATSNRATIARRFMVIQFRIVV